MKIYIACSKWSYEYIDKIKKELQFMGHEVILPSSYDYPMKEERIKESSTKEDHINFVRNCLSESQKKTKQADILLVLNFDKVKDGVIYKNYIGGATFLEIYDSYKEGNNIYLYNDIPEGILYDEIEGMISKVINGNLFKLDKNYEKYKNNHLLNYLSSSELEAIEKLDIHQKAVYIISNVFRNKKDKAGQPYMGHLFRVSGSFSDPIEKAAGLLHDIVEDTDITYYDLLEVGFPLEVVEVVSLVTKQKIDKTNLSRKERLEIYNREIDRIIESGNISAIRLKESDISDNFSEYRLKKLTLEDQEWLKDKYEKQLIKLRKVKGIDKK